MRGWLADARFTLRRLGREPRFSALVAGTLALGIGAVLVLFAVANALFLRPLPYPEADRIVRLHQKRTGASGPGNFSGPNFFDLRESGRSFGSLVAYGAWWNPTLTGRGPAAVVDGAFATAGLFDVLGVAPGRGRGFVPEDEGRNVAVVSHDFWRDRLGGAPDVLGSTITLNQEPFEVVGVMPPGFRAPGDLDGDVWVHNPVQPQDGRRTRNLHVLARLAPGVSAARARAELGAISSRLARAHPEDRYPEFGMSLLTLRNDLFGAARAPTYVLLGAAFLLLLIACANVSSLLLARGLERRREMSLRSALGAGRGRLARQLLLENLTLGAAGALLGLGLAAAATALLPRVLPPDLGVSRLPLDWRVVGSAVPMALLVTLVSGMAPALRTARVDVAGVLRDGGRGSAGRGGVRARELLVAFQTALAVSLLIGAGLLARSLLGLVAVDPGFDPQGAVGMRVDLPAQSYDERDAQSAFYRELTARVRNLPGVAAAGVVSALPLSGSYHTEGAALEGEPPSDPLPLVDVYTVSPGYRAAMGIRLSAGRELDGRDRKDAAPVALVDEAFVRRHVPDGRAVGRRIRLDGRGGERTIVGVVHHVKQRRLDAEGLGQVYVPLAQVPERFMYLVARGEGGAAPPVAAIRRTVGGIDPAVAVATVEGLDDLVAGSLGDRRFPLWVLGTFAALALALTAVGLAGLTAFVVRRRRSELAIRVALGASPSDVVGLVLRRGALLVAAGVTAGLALGVAGGRLLSGLLYRVSPADPAVMLEIVALVGLIALLAAWVPARRAAGVAPGSALRAE